MSSSASRILSAAIVVTFPLSCASAPENLFTSGGSASTSHTGGAISTTGGAIASGGALNGTGGSSAGSGGAVIGTGGTLGGTGGTGGTGGAATAGKGGSISTGGLLSTGGAAGQVATLTYEATISSPTDDCTWINGTEERLRFSDSEPVLEVGTDAEMGRVGLRFPLPLAAGAHIVSAILRIYRVGGQTADTDTLAVQAFDVPNVAPFDGTHMHAPEAHASGGLWATKVGGMPVGKASQFTQSPDLAPLVQHVLDKPEWLPGGAIGFVLYPETMSGWASYADSASAVGKATLRLSYAPR